MQPATAAGEASFVLPWEFKVHLEDGQAFVWITVCVCVLVQASLRPLLGSHAATKLVSILFGVMAIVGGLREVFATEEPVRLDPIYGYSARNQFYLSVAAGYFAWASFNTVLYTSNPLAFVHHALCCATYTLALRPFLHHIGCLFLLFQASSLVLDVHSALRMMNGGPLPQKLAKHLLGLHAVVFVVVRVIVGVPMSLCCLYSLAELLLSGEAHSIFAVGFAVLSNLFINGLNLLWLRSLYKAPFSESKSPVCGSSTPCSEACGDEVSKAPAKASAGADSGHSSTLEQPLWMEFSIGVPTQVSEADEHLRRWRARQFRLRLSFGLIRAMLITATAAILGLIAWRVHPLPEPKSLDLFNSTYHGAHERETSEAIGLRAEQKADELLARLGGQLPRLHGDVDVAISGGGFRGQYAGGVLAVLQALERRGVLKLQRFAGTSVGALTAASFMAHPSKDNNYHNSYFRTHYGWQMVWQTQRFWEGGAILRRMLETVLTPPDLHEQVSGKLFVHITEFTPFPRSRVVSKFHSKEHLFDALCASSAVPAFTGDPFFSSFEGRLAADGSMTKNTPTFEDGVRPQIVINLGWLSYNALYTFSPLDYRHEELASKGMDDAVRVLAGEDVRPLHILQPDYAAGADSTRLFSSMFKELHHILVFDIISWGFYSFGPALLFSILTAVAAAVAVAEGLQMGKGGGGWLTAA